MNLIVSYLLLVAVLCSSFRSSFSEPRDEVAKLEQEVFRDTPRKLLSPSSVLARLIKLEDLFKSIPNSQTSRKQIEKFINLSDTSTTICLEGDKFMSTDAFEGTDYERVRKSNIESYEIYFKAKQFSKCNNLFSSQVRKFNRSVDSRAKSNFLYLVDNLVESSMDVKGAMSVEEYKKALIQAIAKSMKEKSTGRLDTEDKFKQEFDKFVGNYCQKSKIFLSKLDSFYTPLVQISREDLVEPKILYHINYYKTCENLMLHYDELLSQAFKLYE